MEHYRRTWTEIDLDKIKRNLQCIRSLLDPGTAIMGIIKADAYGHGAIPVASELKDDVAMFAVSGLDEAVQLRKGGISNDILILGYTPADSTDELIRLGITQTVFSYEYARKLYTQACKLDKELKVHIKIDTGMSRLGFAAQTRSDALQSEDEILQIISQFGRALHVEGIFTHFAVSDEPEDTFTAMQFERFTGVCKALQDRGIRLKYRHCCNSGAIIDFPHMQLDMVRPGIILYGMQPAKGLRDIGLSPALSLKTVVAQTHRLKKGMSISYGRTYIAQSDMTVATIPIGYADGYPRALSNIGQVLVNGRRANIVGRICMDQCVIDISDIPNVHEGSIVTVIGRDGKETITAEEIADKLGSINYEITCLIGKRVPRVYFKNNTEVDSRCYITD